MKWFDSSHPSGSTFSYSMYSPELPNPKMLSYSHKSEGGLFPSIFSFVENKIATNTRSS